MLFDEGYDSGDDLANSFENDPILQENPQATLNELDADKNSGGISGNGTMVET